MLSVDWDAKLREVTIAQHLALLVVSSLLTLGVFYIGYKLNQFASRKKEQRDRVCKIIEVAYNERKDIISRTVEPLEAALVRIQMETVPTFSVRKKLTPEEIFEVFLDAVTQAIGRSASLLEMPDGRRYPSLSVAISSESTEILRGALKVEEKELLPQYWLCALNILVEDVRDLLNWIQLESSLLYLGVSDRNKIILTTHQKNSVRGTGCYYIGKEPMTLLPTGMLKAWKRRKIERLEETTELSPSRDYLGKFLSEQANQG